MKELSTFLLAHLLVARERSEREVSSWPRLQVSKMDGMIQKLISSGSSWYVDLDNATEYQHSSHSANVTASWLRAW